MSVIVPVDQQTRDEIREKLAANLCVEAGAGTGKTTVLVDRIVQILRTGYADIDQLVVITFTEKAAAELSGRIREQLEAAYGDSSELEERARLDQALRGLPRARIETIHAFAAGLLRERPVEAGLDPGFEVLDNLGADLNFDEAFRTWLTGHLQGRPEPLWRALNRGLEFTHLREAAEALHNYRDLLPLAPQPAPSADIHGFVVRLQTHARELRGLLDLCTDLDDYGARQIRQILEFTEECRAVATDADALERLILRAPKISARGANPNWADPSANARQKEFCTELKDDLATTQAALRTDAVAGLLPLLAQFVQWHEGQRRRAGKAEFDDLLIWARNLLRDDLGVRRYFQERFRCILVDEFQDTDPLQTEIILYLCSDGQAGTDWRDLRPAPGKLFVVGDPKQSIYRFRRADIAIYEQVKQEVLGDGLRRIQQNFRSLPGVINWVNRVFDTLIVPVPSAQPEYVPLEAVPPHLNSQRPPVVVLPGSGTAETANDIRQEEAERLAALLRQAVLEEGWVVRDVDTKEARPARWGDIAMLMPRRTGIEVYEQALAAAGIPYRHEGGRAFFQRQEVRDLIACLRTIDDPTDRVALVAALRSGAFGCSDQDLLRFVAGGGRLDYRVAPPAGHPAVGDGLTMLADLRRLRYRLALPEFVRSVLDQTRLVEFALTLDHGEQAAGNLLKVVDQARAFHAAQGGGLRAFVRWLTTSSESRADEADAAVAEVGDDVVRLLTIHAAKGLEFPIVALANLNSQQNNRTNVIPDRGTGRLHLRFGSSKDGYFQTSGFAEALEREKTHAAAEDIRLLYVAATRARDHLIVPAVPAPDKAKGMLAELLRCLPLDVRDHLGQDIGDQHIHDPGLLQFDERPEPQSTPVEPEADVVAATLERRDAWRARRTDLIAQASRGARVTTASSVKGWDDLSPSREDEDADRPVPADGAAALGRAVHTVLERVDLDGGADLAAVAQAAALEASILGRADEVAELAQRCLESPVVARAIRAKRFYREVSYSLGLPDGSLVEGRVDLLFQEGDALVIADYKTDRVSGPDVDERVETYRGQAAIYAFAVSRVTGRPVREVVFVFARLGVERTFAIDETLLLAGKGLAASGLAHGAEDD